MVLSGFQRLSAGTVAFAELPTLLRKVGLTKQIGTFFSSTKLGTVLRNEIGYLLFILFNGDI
jgi:hypothetical protein